jgi:putative Ca2+/H+ antiporter (TMEM165/GDT1 family)
VQSLHAIGASLVAVFLAEMGDKTQLLALVLGARFREPVPVIAGITLATAANHAAAAWFGVWLATLLSPQALLLAQAASFLAFGLWALRPDRPEATEPRPSMGPLVASLILFFIAECGDKTQFATIALSARFGAFLPVTLGTTAGLVLANAPVVLLGHKFFDRLPLGAIRVASALLFVGFGLLALGDWWQARLP